MQNKIIHLSGILEYYGFLSQEVYNEALEILSSNGDNIEFVNDGTSLISIKDFNIKEYLK